MITINVIENQISGSYGDTPFSVNYSEDTYGKMMELSDRQQSVTTMDEYNTLMEEFAKLTIQDYKTTVETECPIIHVNEATGQFFLKHNDVVSSVILGMNSKEQVEDNFKDYSEKITEDFWKSLRLNNLIDLRSPIK